MTSAKELYNRISREAQQREITPDELKHLQNVLLRCYLDVQAACEKHGLNIMLGGGSCLGAVRKPRNDGLSNDKAREILS